MLFISNYWKLCGKMQFWEEKVAKQALFLMNSLQKKGKNNLAKVQLSIKNTYIGKMLKSLRLYWPLISILQYCSLKFLSFFTIGYSIESCWNKKNAMALKTQWAQFDKTRKFFHLKCKYFVKPRGKTLHRWFHRIFA